jgi:hypothetical protein
VYLFWYENVSSGNTKEKTFPVGLLQTVKKMLDPTSVLMENRNFSHCGRDCSPGSCTMVQRLSLIEPCASILVKYFVRVDGVVVIAA